MISSTELRAGKTFQIEQIPYQVIKYEHIKIGRGGATVRTTARNLQSGRVEEMTFSTSQTIEAIQTVKKRLQYLYSDDEVSTFIDPQTYEQVEVKKAILENQLPFLKEGQNVDVLFWTGGGDSGKDEPLGVDLPPKVTLCVAETDPGVKGNSATNIYKSATLENGLTVRVPLFIKVGDQVRVDTRTSEYIERAK